MKATWKGLTLVAPALLAGALTLAVPALAQTQAPDPMVKHFNYMDKGKKGYLVEDDFKMMGKDYKQKFKDADTNHDGKMTLEEFKAWEAKQKKSSMPGMNM